MKQEETLDLTELRIIEQNYVILTNQINSLPFTDEEIQTLLDKIEPRLQRTRDLIDVLETLQANTRVNL